MLSYVLAGLGLGSVYAIAASSLVITYVASGIFNLAFAAMAYTVARIYYLLNTEWDWGILPAAVVSLLVFAPLFGMALYAVLFRHLRLRSMLVKLIATVGLSVALPALVDLLLDKVNDSGLPGLAPRPLHVWHVFGTTINGDRLATYIGLVLVLVIGVGILRFTTIGLKVRALVDSEALTGLSGTSPSRVSLGVWAATAVLAGLAGILLTPLQGISSNTMTALMTVAFAAVVAAKLRSLPVAVVVALLMGVITTTSEYFIDPEGDFIKYFKPSIPFLFMLVALVYFTVRGQTADTVAGGALDRAISTQGGDPSLVSSQVRSSSHRLLTPALVVGVVVVIIAALMPGYLDAFWSRQYALGLGLAILLLSYTLVTGEGGMVWLSQATFAGGGAVLAAELVRNWGWNPLVAVLVGGVFIAPVGILLGLITIRLGNLYVALVTLTFGLLIQSLVLTRPPFSGGSGKTTGQRMPRPDFIVTNDQLAYVILVVFVLLAILIVNVRRSTAGLALSAVRFSENGARTLGISVVQTKVLVSGLAVYTAAVGGGFMAMGNGLTLPNSFHPQVGLIWLAVLLTLGARSNIAALVAGIVFTMAPLIISDYISDDYKDVPTILFGLGALGLAMHPEGALAQAGNAVLGLFGRRRPRSAAEALDARQGPDDQRSPASGEPVQPPVGGQAARGEAETISAGGKA